MGIDRWDWDPEPCYAFNWRSLFCRDGTGEYIEVNFTNNLR